MQIIFKVIHRVLHIIEAVHKVLKVGYINITCFKNFEGIYEKRFLLFTFH